ncbi:MAG: tRNA (adenosine(37)-N6)-threonylcarbamoyltransferase complex transferase subunit TsaD [Tepidiphilus sp.]|nr:tRNA (adenosine(37)-N6)-threonylcarbamoyltransferase complex transferase subunit TsaD [Tepidiphilus sp.]
MHILGIESSCDETGVALYDTSRGLLAHRLHTQARMHATYGGVVPELASRDHVRRLPALVREVMSEGARDWTELDVVAYTAGPGLAGALLVGASFAESLALALDRSTLPVHHLEGHLLSPLLAEPRPEFPFLALLVSGGHTQLMAVRAVGDYRLLGETIDDAAGEAFDKTAKLLGLGYPGGPALAALAEQGDPARFALPRPLLHAPTLDFSFSGLKTAVALKVGAPDWRAEYAADLAASFQQAVVEVLVAKTMAAVRATGLPRVVVAGGVGANRRLREALAEAGAEQGFAVFYPDVALCTDNGAMIAFAAALRLEAGARVKWDRRIEVHPRWALEGLRQG